jgi:hypothetical protein
MTLARAISVAFTTTTLPELLFHAMQVTAETAGGDAATWAAARIPIVTPGDL